jgi:hypothetical protein
MTLHELRPWHSFKERSGAASALKALRPLARGFLAAAVCVMVIPFSVLCHCAMCYDTLVSVSLRCERWVTHAPCKSARPFVPGNLTILPSRPPTPVELWHVYGWGRLCQHRAQYGGKPREFLATLLHRHSVSNLL